MTERQFSNYYEAFDVKGSGICREIRIKSSGRRRRMKGFI